MFKAIKAAIYAYVHNKGWCSKFHIDAMTFSSQKEKNNWRSECPFKDSAMLILFPPMKTNRKVGEEIASKGLEPGQIIIEES